MDYKQVSCSFFDRIELLIISKKSVKIEFFDAKNNKKIENGIITNVFSEKKAEFLYINNSNIRLDKIISISENN